MDYKIALLLDFPKYKIHNIINMTIAKKLPIGLETFCVKGPAKKYSNKPSMYSNAFP